MLRIDKVSTVLETMVTELLAALGSDPKSERAIKVAAASARAALAAMEPLPVGKSVRIDKVGFLKLAKTTEGSLTITLSTIVGPARRITHAVSAEKARRIFGDSEYATQVAKYLFEKQ